MGLIANDDVTEVTVLKQTNVIAEGYTRLLVTADFQSFLESFYVTTEENKQERLPTRSGEYGLKIIIDNEEFYLSSKNDMIGSPYDFPFPTQQKKIFEIKKSLSVIKNLQVVLYQKNDFNVSNGQRVPVDEVNKVNNIFVSNVSVQFGYDKEDDLTDTVTISSDKEFYSAESTDGETATITLSWLHKTSDRKLKTMTIEDIDTNYQIKWNRYNSGWEEVAGIAREDLFAPTFTLTNVLRERFKAVICDMEGTVLYESNVLTLDNEGSSLSKTLSIADYYLYLDFSDGSNGRYYYVSNNDLPDSATITPQIKASNNRGNRNPSEVTIEKLKINDIETDASKKYYSYNPRTQLTNDATVVRFEAITSEGRSYYATTALSKTKIEIPVATSINLPTLGDYKVSGQSFSESTYTALRSIGLNNSSNSQTITYIESVTPITETITLQDGTTKEVVVGITPVEKTVNVYTNLNLSLSPTNVEIKAIHT